MHAVVRVHRTCWAQHFTGFVEGHTKAGCAGTRNDCKPVRGAVRMPTLQRDGGVVRQAQGRRQLSADETTVVRKAVRECDGQPPISSTVSNRLQYRALIKMATVDATARMKQRQRGCVSPAAY